MRWRDRTWLVEKLVAKVPSENRAEYESLQPPDAETLATWVETARARRPVLFVGAGWSLNAESAPRAPGDAECDKPRALTWSEIAEELQGQLAHDGGKVWTDPLWLAELYRQRFGTDALQSLIARAVPDDRLLPGPLHQALTRVPWHSILTTNYDTLLERAFEPHRRVHVCVDDSDLVRSAHGRGVEIVHLHGHIQRPSTIVLAYEDYRQYPRKHPGLLAKVRQLFLQHPVLFIGFSLTDPNFLQWAGWLEDLVNEEKNPWVSLTCEPSPSLPFARYWGTRVHFVSIQNNPDGRFAAVVVNVLQLLGAGLAEKDERPTRNEWRASLRAKHSPEAVAEFVAAQLDIGNQRGYAGSDWDASRAMLFDDGASRVLELADVTWRELPVDPSSNNTRIEILLDAFSPISRGGDQGLIDELQSAFGAAWATWTSLVAGLDDRAWHFSRVDFSGGRREDLANYAVVPLRAAAPPLVGAAPGGTALLDALRAGDALKIPASPSTPQDWRLAGYVAFQQGDAPEALRCYREAAVASRRAHEPLSTEWLTLRSQAAALHQLKLFDPQRAKSLEQEEHALWDSIERIEEGLARLPREEGAEPLRSNCTSTISKLADRLIDDLNRRDTDRAMRFGRMYGNAEEWLDRLEQLWLAPPRVAQAAEALGILQWRYGDWTDAVRTLSRYGSERLRKVSATIARDPNAKPDDVAKFIDELLRDGRWPAEWLAHAESLVPLLPQCTARQLNDARRLVARARAALSSVRLVGRGTSTAVAPWFRTAVEGLEASIWRWLAPSDAVAAVKRWVDECAAVPSRIVATTTLPALQRLPWKAWGAAASVGPATIEPILSGLVQARLSDTGQNRDDTDFAAVLDILLTCHVDGAVSLSSTTPLRVQVDQCVARMAGHEQTLYKLSLARLDDDRTRLQELVAGALPAATDRVSLHRTAEIVAAARQCPSEHSAQVVSSLAELTRQTVTSLTGDPEEYVRSAALGDAHAVAFAVHWLLRSDSVWMAEELLAFTENIVKVAPSSATCLAAVPRDTLGALHESIDQAVLALLRGVGPGQTLSQREARVAGLNGVAYALYHVGALAVGSEWLATVATLTGTNDPDLARDATRLLADWTARRGDDDKPDLLDTVVAPALRTAALSRHVLVKAAGLKGLAALNRRQPSALNGGIIDSCREDPRLAVQRALEEPAGL